MQRFFSLLNFRELIFMRFRTNGLKKNSEFDSILESIFARSHLIFHCFFRSYFQIATFCGVRFKFSDSLPLWLFCLVLFSNTSCDGIDDEDLHVVPDNQIIQFETRSNSSFSDVIPEEVLADMYFPDITSSWRITRVTSNTDGTAVLNLMDEYGNVTVKTALAGVIAPFYYNGDLIGYFKINKVDGGYSKINKKGYPINIDHVVNIDNSPEIKEYINRKENILLLGDSFFGYRTQNYLLEYLICKTDKFIANAGYGNCRAAWRTSDGSNDWDNMSLVDVVDAIVDNDYTNIFSAIDNLSTSYQYFKDRTASLKSIDLTKPTIVFIGYGNNDVTSGSAIGDLWDKTQEASTYDKTTYLGAINYGIEKLLKAFPNVKIIVLNPGWRMIDGVAPYEYINKQGISFNQYLSAIKENLERCGVRLFDFYSLGGRCAFNWDYYSVDNSHFNMLGYEMFASAIADEAEKL